MHQNSVTLDSAGAITRYFAKANLHTQQETLGEIVTPLAHPQQRPTVHGEADAHVCAGVQGEGKLKKKNKE